MKSLIAILFALMVIVFASWLIDQGDEYLTVSAIGLVLSAAGLLLRVFKRPVCYRVGQ